MRIRVGYDVEVDGVYKGGHGTETVVALRYQEIDVPEISEDQARVVVRGFGRPPRSYVSLNGRLSVAAEEIMYTDTVYLSDYLRESAWAKDNFILRPVYSDMKEFDRLPLVSWDEERLAELDAMARRMAEGLSLYQGGFWRVTPEPRIVILYDGKRVRIGTSTGPHDEIDVTHIATYPVSQLDDALVFAREVALHAGVDMACHWRFEDVQVLAPELLDASLVDNSAQALAAHLVFNFLGVREGVQWDGSDIFNFGLPEGVATRFTALKAALRGDNDADRMECIERVVDADLDFYGVNRRVSAFAAVDLRRRLEPAREHALAG